MKIEKIIERDPYIIPLILVIQLHMRTPLPLLPHVLKDNKNASM